MVPWTHLKRPNGEIKHDLYEVLSRGACRERDIQRVTGRSRPTLEVYLTKGAEDGEIKKDPRTREYSLTPAGWAELDRLRTARGLEQAPCHYPAELDHRLTWGDPSQWLGREPDPSLFYSSAFYSQLPLPVKVYAAVYASKELQAWFLNYQSDAIATVEMGLAGARDVPRLVLENPMVIEPGAVEQFVWNMIGQRMDLLAAELENQNPRERAPLFTLENILGFDTSLTLRYDGAKMFPRFVKKRDGSSLKTGVGKNERKSIARRLAGAILLTIACGFLPLNAPLDWVVKNPAALIAEFEKGGLIDREDAATVSRVLSDAARTRMPGKEMDWPELTRSQKSIIGEIAFRYLKDGGVIAKDWESSIPLADYLTPESDHYRWKGKSWVRE
jgi:DNA-binding PadR family transcriptional regulator